MKRKIRDTLSSHMLAYSALIFVTAIWGSTFVIVKDAVERMPVMDFIAIRFLLATVILMVLRPKSVLLLDRSGWAKGILLGLILGMGYIGQTYGLQYTSAAVCGFITGMFVIFTPLLAGLIFRQPIGKAGWIAVAIATVGLALISLKGFAIGFGELLTLICALFYSIHMIGLGEWSTGRDSYAFAIAQLGTVSIFSIFAAIPGGFTLPPDTTSWVAILITALFASALAFLVQTWVQTIISPTQTAIILTMEPVFAGIFAVLIGGEHLGVRTVTGGAMVVLAMYIAELGPRRSREGELAHLEA